MRPAANYAECLCYKRFDVADFYFGGEKGIIL